MIKTRIVAIGSSYRPVLRFKEESPVALRAVTGNGIVCHMEIFREFCHLRGLKGKFRFYQTMEGNTSVVYWFPDSSDCIEV